MQILDVIAPLLLALTCVALPALIAYRAGFRSGQVKAHEAAQRARRSWRGDR